MCTNMGGRGEKGKILQFSGKSQNLQDKSDKWDYRGYVESVNKIEKAVNEANTRAKVEKAYRGIVEEDRSITAEINRIENGNGDEGDIKVLMTQRRRIRQLKKKLIGKNIL